MWKVNINYNKKNLIFEFLSVIIYSGEIICVKDRKLQNEIILKKK